MLIKVDWNSKKSLKEAVAPKLNDNFWKWFGNSKVVDNQGNPLVCYHGTTSKFDIFNNDKPIWVTPKEKYASMYSDDENIKALYVKLENPVNLGSINMELDEVKAHKLSLATGISEYELNYIWQKVKGDSVSVYALTNSKEFKEALIERGFDGIEAYEGPNKSYAVFNPNQIKSVNNNGNWSTTSNNINEEIAYAESNDGNLKNIILINPSRKELKDNNLLFCRYCYDKDGNYYFGSDYEYTHNDIMLNIKKEKGIQLYDDMGFYDTNENCFYKRYYVNGEDYNEVLKSEKAAMKNNWILTHLFGDFDVKLFDGEYPEEDNLYEWWSGGVNWQNDRKGLGGVGATQDCHLFFFMFPDQFLNLCPKFSYGDDKFFNQYVADRKPMGIPFLWCEIDEEKKTLKVFDHEGRHRVKAIRDYALSKGKSQPDIPVAIIYNKDKYSLPYDISELRKNWKIVSQNGDMSYDIGMFKVQNNLDNQIVSMGNLYESQEPKLNQNFWKWFKGSKTVDEQGNPLIFYHGTKQPNITNFKAKYDDGLIFFAYNEEFAKEWASNAPLTPDQEQGVRDFQRSDDLSNYRKEVMDRYKRDYGDNWADDEDIRKAAKWEIKEYEKQKYKQMGIEENVMPVYIKATKIFNPARDYSKVIKEISAHWDLDLKADYKQEYNEAKAEYDKVNNIINKWFEEHSEYKNDPAMEQEFRKRENILTNALNKFNEVKKKIETRNNHLKRIMSGAWVYFENPETINKIWELGYDAIELAEHDGEISTLAVREGTNQVKSIFNYGEWGESNNIMEAGYQGYSKSNNAVYAENEGKYPASIAAKKLGVSSEAIRRYIYSSEWHHYSSHYNEVYVYDITPYLMLKNGEDLSNDYDQDEINEFIQIYKEMKDFTKSEKIEKTQNNENKYKANVEYIIWTGTRNHPKANVQKYENIWVKEKGDFYTFILPNGEEVRKKKDSNGTYVKPYNEVKKEEKQQKEQLKIAKERYKVFRKNTSRKALKFIYDNNLESNSSGTHYYIMGRKPDSWTYQQLDQWFEKGELRLSSKNPDFMSSAGAYLEQWDGQKWVAIEATEPMVEGNDYLSFYYINLLLKK